MATLESTIENVYGKVGVNAFKHHQHFFSDFDEEIRLCRYTSDRTWQVGALVSGLPANKEDTYFLWSEA